MDMNHDARIAMNRWRTRQKNAERRIINLHERINLQLDALRDRMVIQHMPLIEWQFKQVYYRDVGVYEDIDPDWRTIRVGDTWGGEDVSAFFKCRVTIPENMAGQRIYLHIYVGGDSLLTLDGVPYHGLDPFRSSVLITEQGEAGRTYNVELESYIYWYPAEGVINRFEQAELVSIDADIEAAYWDFVATFKVLHMRHSDPSLKEFLETHLWHALRDIPFEISDLHTFKQSLARIREAFKQAVFETDRFKTSGLLHMVGHSHLDIVYQWTHREYIRKVGRTHATMLRLMEQYPDFKFSQSSAKIYADMKEYFPDLFAQVKQRIADGQWQPVGAFWLEPDCNLISGESFVRHILHGQAFWQREFGFTSRVCWQPDVFGMSWAMPQILHRSGIDIALCNKFFVWNDTNPWRQNTFRWQGPDGSQIMMFIPPGHFIGMVDPDHMNQYWEDYGDKETLGEVIYTYGWGDGGGGVDPEMVECAMRYADFPGVVPNQFNHPEDTLLSIAESAKENNTPVWYNELYLEAHRGTYTTKGWLKKHNRQSEILLRNTELLATLAWQEGQPYPADTLDSAWKILLNTQFHDALPGTHINEVYHYLLDEYHALRQHAKHLQGEATQYLFGVAKGDNLLVFNPDSFSREGIITIPETHLGDAYLEDDTGNPYLQQTITRLDGSKDCLVAIEGAVPSVGYRVFKTTTTPPDTSESKLHATDNTLENRFLRAEFAPNGELVSLWDKEAQREVLLAGEHGNKFQLYQDKPGKYDAWDIVASYVEHEIPIEGSTQLSINDFGALQVSLKVVRQCHQSTITQIIRLSKDDRALTFETHIDWHERQRLLKVGFPVDINARHATYDIAYGNIERPTHRNTSFDAARFEVPAHWWMDMSESGYGVALLNDCKYGHETHGHWMRLTLLKGSISPDPHADREEHFFTYALVPHLGDWCSDEGNIQAQAHYLNVLLQAYPTTNAPEKYSYIHCPANNVTLEAVKKAEDGESVILRFVERENQRTQTQLVFDRPLAQVVTCDLMENQEDVLEPRGNEVTIRFKPREILTLAITFAE